MKMQATVWRYLTALAVLASCGLGIFAGAGGDAPKPLPPEIVKAWRNAGADIGWETKMGRFVRGEEKGEIGAVPAFLFSMWSDGVLAKLPDPGMEFGLWIWGVTDEGLKELKKLERLQRLVLYRTAVTDAGMKELSSLKQLQMLVLSLTRVTDAGMNELQKSLPYCRIIKNF